MKLFAMGLGMSGLLLLACSDDTTPNTGGSSGSANNAGTGGSASGAATGGSAGMTTAGSTTGGSAAGSGGSGGSGGSAAGTAGAGGVSGAAGSAGAGGSGGSAGGACDTNLGKAIKFTEKVKDLVAGDLGADAPTGDSARTLELWAKFSGANSWTAEQSIIELGKPSQPDNGNNVFGIDMSGRKGAGGVFGPYTHGVSDNNGTNAPPFLDNTAEGVGWLHLAWVYDPTKTPANTRLQFTVNGNVLPTEFVQAKYEATGSKLVINTGYVLLGASQTFGNDGWEGVMDEVRIWNVARTPQQIKDTMKVIVKPDTAGLVAYYQFNEGDAANIADSTKKAAHTLKACTAAGMACPAANTMAPTFVASDVPGPFTCAP
jgi:hypothetical protein